jgi:phosphomannomutase
VDIGFAHDPDADSMVIINEHGVVISEEYTLGFWSRITPCRKIPAGSVVINMSTSQMIPDIALKYGSKCIRTKVGEANVMAGMIEYDAIVGGEGTSGVIFPTLNNCRDSFVSLTLALQLLAERKSNCYSGCVESLPKYFMKRDKWPVNDDLQHYVRQAERAFR